LVGLCERKGLKRLADLSDADLTEASPKLGPEAKDLLGVEKAVAAFKSYGSTAPAEVAKQLGRWKTKLEM
jgi:argininosuccinate lyase